MNKKGNSRERMSKLLFIQYRLAGKVMNGGDQATKRNYDMLCKAHGEENVEVYLIHQENRSAWWEYVLGVLYMPFGFFFGLTPKRVEELKEKAKDYSCVFIDRSVFGILAKELKNGGYRGKIITHFHNVEKRYFNEKMSKRLPFRRILINCADKNDRWSCAYSDSVITLNERDKLELKELYQRETDFIIPVTLNDQLVKEPDKKVKTNKRVKCLSIGAYFAPNNEGILWFVKHVLPHVDVEYKIVGRGMAKLKEENPEVLRDIEVISDAPSLAPYFEEADVMILPIFSGSGMKVKTCESLMYGKNIIATDEALEGYAIEEGVSAWRCNTPEEFIDCINKFIAHPRPKWNENARQCYLDNYSEKAVEKVFKELLD